VWCNLWVVVGLGIMQDDGVAVGFIRERGNFERVTDNWEMEEKRSCEEL